MTAGPTSLADELRAVPILEGFTDAQVAELAAAGEEVSLSPGEHVFDEGRAADDWWVLLDGRIDLVRRIGHEEAVMATMAEAGQWAGGFKAWDDNGVYMGSGRVTAPTRVFRLPAAELGRFGETWFPFAVHLLRGLIGTARRIEHNARQREALVALGTLAAGLAHEINNPASAAVRSVGALQQSSDDVFASLQRLAGAGISASQFVTLDELRRSIDPSAAPTGVALSDLEEALADWLEDSAIDRSWVIASALAGAGVTVPWLDRAASALSGPALQAGLEWVASAVTTTALIKEAQDSTRRISDLVSAVKSYSQLDRASIQDVRVVDGLESTLIMLGHKLRAGGVDVVRDYDDSVPTISANPGELNQVWTNLVDNAVDAMEGGGTLTVRTYADDRHVVVEICDTGHGMSDEVAAHAFEPFFTTKEVGKGTGLGLDISRRIVVERHGGEIDVDSRPGLSVVRVGLPRAPAVRQPPAAS
jgi:signal transduction histidine kinase